MGQVVKSDGDSMTSGSRPERVTDSRELKNYESAPKLWLEPICRTENGSPRAHTHTASEMNRVVVVFCFFLPLLRICLVRIE